VTTNNALKKMIEFKREKETEPLAGIMSRRLGFGGSTHEKEPLRNRRVEREAQL